MAAKTKPKPRTEINGVIVFGAGLDAEEAIRSVEEEYKDRTVTWTFPKDTGDYQNFTVSK